MKGWENTRQVGVLVRPQIRFIDPTYGDSLVAYFRRSVPRAVVRALRGCGLPVKIYGLGAHAPPGNLTYWENDSERFVEDLAQCRALLCTAGNQLIGEAMYLGKPVIALPEPGNMEQAINAHYVEVTGAGRALEMSALTTEYIKGFVDQCDEVTGYDVTGNDAVVTLIRRYLGILTARRTERRQKKNALVP